MRKSTARGWTLPPSRWLQLMENKRQHVLSRFLPYLSFLIHISPSIFIHQPCIHHSARAGHAIFPTMLVTKPTYSDWKDFQQSWQLTKLKDASDVMAVSPSALQLRYLQVRNVDLFRVSWRQIFRHNNCNNHRHYQNLCSFRPWTRFRRRKTTQSSFPSLSTLLPNF